MEKRLSENKIGENGQANEVKRQLEYSIKENSELKMQLRESQTAISILRSEMAELKAICTEENSEQLSITFDNCSIGFH